MLQQRPESDSGERETQRRHNLRQERQLGEPGEGGAETLLAVRSPLGHFVDSIHGATLPYERAS